MRIVFPGKQAAIALARMGATLVLACRTRKTAEQTMAEIKKSTGNEKISLIDLDLARYAITDTQENPPHMSLVLPLYVSVQL